MDGVVKMLRDIYELVKALVRRRSGVAELTGTNLLVIVTLALMVPLGYIIANALGQAQNIGPDLQSIVTAGGSNVEASLAAAWNAIVHFSP